jgi:hypothetical protein
MGCVAGLLDPADCHGGGIEVYLRPLQVYQFGRPKAVPVTDKDHGRVTTLKSHYHGGMGAQPLPWRADWERSGV